MSIVPQEVIQDIRETWPARDMPLLEYAIERAAEWALRRAASECDELEYFRAAEVIRAMIKGGESDEN